MSFLKREKPQQFLSYRSGFSLFLAAQNGRVVLRYSQSFRLNDRYNSTGLMTMIATTT
jgi:hypothetical protein